MQYVPGMIIFVIGLIRLVVALMKTDPMAKASGLKSAFVSMGIGVAMIILFSTVLKRDRGDAPVNNPAPVTQDATPPAAS